MPPTARAWDEDAHVDLLLAYVDELKPNKVATTSVSDRMKDRGYPYSYQAIMYLLYYLPL